MFLCTSVRNRGTAVSRCKSWSESSSTPSETRLAALSLLHSRQHLKDDSWDSQSQQVGHHDDSSSLSASRLGAFVNSRQHVRDDSSNSLRSPKVGRHLLFRDLINGDISSRSDTRSSSSPDARPTGMKVRSTASVNDDLPSVGSSLHVRGNCKPCAYVNTAEGCRSGKLCVFCHDPDHAAEEAIRRPSKGARSALKKRMKEIDESNMTEDMKREAYTRLAGKNAYMMFLLTKLHPDLFSGDSDSKEACERAAAARQAAGVSEAASYSGASSVPCTAPAAPGPRIPGLQPAAEWTNVPYSPTVPGKLLQSIPEKQNDTKVSL
eukprot:TRINITY_DN47144_c0_g1_i1.p1 TRINITY_DN47144_c0_g1~~TRINITY_DN47144_c0_g1_i1.p1  ORF type:complete len:363 (-),score=18.09 TRINITY_DN47144_c0_g1_i1:94-1056(-)